MVIRFSVIRRPCTVRKRKPSKPGAESGRRVSTYSSTVLDALIFGVPSIEYLIILRGKEMSPSQRGHNALQCPQL